MSEMRIEQMNKQLQAIQKKKEDTLYRKNLLLKQYETLKETVKKCGLGLLICILFEAVVLTILRGSKSATLAALGGFLSPFAFLVMTVLMIILIIKGFDLLINADTKMSGKLASKLEKDTMTEQIDIYNNMLIKLEVEIDKLENRIYEKEKGKKAESSKPVLTHGQTKTDAKKAFEPNDDFDKFMEELEMDANDSKLSKAATKALESKTPESAESELEALESKISESKASESKELETQEAEFKTEFQETESEVEQPVYEINEFAQLDAKNDKMEKMIYEKFMEDKAAEDEEIEEDISKLIFKNRPMEMPKTNEVKKRNDIDDILNGLDGWDDEEDEFESSSDMWKKDAMRDY